MKFSRISVLKISGEWKTHQQLLHRQKFCYIILEIGYNNLLFPTQGENSEEADVALAPHFQHKFHRQV